MLSHLKFVCTCDPLVDKTKMKYNESKRKVVFYMWPFLQTLPDSIRNYSMVILLAEQIQPNKLTI